MAMRFGGAIFVLVALIMSIFAIAEANKDWSTVAGNWNHTGGANNFSWGYNYWHKNATQRSNKFVVGGSDQWRFGFNYTDWAIKNGPFYLNDTLGKLHKLISSVFIYIIYTYIYISS